MEVLLVISEPDDVDVEGATLVPVDFGVETKTVGTLIKSREGDMGAAVAEALAKVAPAGGRIVHLLCRDPHDRLEFPLVGVSEFAAMRGVSRQYASTVADKKGFPDAESALRATKVWHIVDVAWWNFHHEKQRNGVASVASLNGSSPPQA